MITAGWDQAKVNLPVDKVDGSKFIIDTDAKV